MSLEASVFTPSSEPISIDELVRSALESGWALRPVHDVFEPERFGPTSGGTMGEHDYFYGWRVDDRDAAEYERTLAAGQIKQLEHWAQRDFKKKLGAAWISVNEYDHESLYAGDDSELSEQKGSEFVEALRLAKREYVVKLQANNDEFRLVLARFIQKLRGGIWVDHLGEGWGTFEEDKGPKKSKKQGGFLSRLLRGAGLIRAEG